MTYYVTPFVARHNLVMKLYISFGVQLVVIRYSIQLNWLISFTECKEVNDKDTEKIGQLP